jgi:uncharacterized protein (TIGR02996 family)
MDEENAFLAALSANPLDETARLVFADWLEEHGDRRSEFLRAAVAVGNAAVTDADFHQRLRHLNELRSVVSPGWLLRAYRILAEDDVREVVLREMVGEGSAAFVSFLRVENDQDPSPYLFAQVAGRCAGVEPASAAEWREGGYYDMQSGCRGSLVSIDGLEWVAEDRCNVVGSYFSDPLAASGSLYRVEIKDGGWAIVEVSGIWIS